MGLIHIEMFATLDLVGQAPGGPDEDPVGFPFGGWQAPLMDEVSGAQAGAAYEDTDALLLGRRTYDLFAAYWPHQEGGQDNKIAALFNSVPKYVVSRTLKRADWNNSTIIREDVVAAVTELKQQDGSDLMMYGYGRLNQTLLEHHLVDEIRFSAHPGLAAGRAAGGGQTLPLKLLAATPSPNGVVALTYEPTSS